MNNPRNITRPTTIALSFCVIAFTAFGCDEGAEHRALGPGDRTLDETDVDGLEALADLVRWSGFDETRGLVAVASTPFFSLGIANVWEEDGCEPPQTPQLDSDFCELHYVNWCSQTDVAAGTVRVSGGLLPDFELTPGDDGSYAPELGFGSFFAGGETLRFSTEGALPAVPPMDGWTLAPPADIAFSRSWEEGGSIDRAADLALAWEFDDSLQSEILQRGNSVTVFVTPSVADGESPMALHCTFPINDRAGVIPSEGLSHLPAGNARVSVQTLAEDRVERFGQTYAFQAISQDLGGAQTVVLGD